MLFKKIYEFSISFYYIYIKEKKINVKINLFFFIQTLN